LKEDNELLVQNYIKEYHFSAIEVSTTKKIDFFMQAVKTNYENKIPQNGSRISTSREHSEKRRNNKLLTAVIRMDNFERIINKKPINSKPYDFYLLLA